MGKRTGFALGLVALFATAGCSSPNGTNTGDVPKVKATELSPRIVNGTPSPSSQDAVVLIYMSDGFCSGTLITPNLVLTARHCTTNNDESAGQCGMVYGQLDPSSLQIALGASEDVNDPTVSAHGVKLYDDGNSNLFCGHDVALIQLDHDLTGAQTAIVRSAAATASELVTAIGFGDDGSGTPTQGRYQRSGLKILGIGPTSFQYAQQSGQKIPVDLAAGELATGESTCYGDSGGPLLDAQGMIVGVTSYGFVDTCYDAPGAYSDVPAHYQLIAQAAASAGHPLPPPSAGVGDAGASGDGSTAHDGGHVHNNSDGGGDDDGDDDPFGGAVGGDLSPGVPALPDAGSKSTSSDAPAASSGCAVAHDARFDASWALMAFAVAWSLRRRRRA